jgi:hypothetical protein
LDGNRAGARFPAQLIVRVEVNPPGIFRCHQGIELLGQLPAKSLRFDVEAIFGIDFKGPRIEV